MDRNLSDDAANATNMKIPSGTGLCDDKKDARGRSDLGPWHSGCNRCFATHSPNALLLGEVVLRANRLADRANRFLVVILEILID